MLSLSRKRIFFDALALFFTLIALVFINMQIALERPEEKERYLLPVHPTEWMQKQVVRTAEMMEVSESYPKDPYSGRIFDTVVLYGQGFPPPSATSLSSETATAPMIFLIWTRSIFHWLPENMIL